MARSGPVGRLYFVVLSLLAVVGAAAGSAVAQAPEPQARSVSVNVRGVDGALRDNVLAFLGIAELEERGIVARLDPRNDVERVSVTELERRHRAAPAQIRDALMPFGYYQPQIDSELVETRAGFEARYRIDPGPAVRLRNVEIRAEGEGADLPAVQQAVAAAGLEPGDRLLHQRYDAAREAIFDAAYDRGFLNARWRVRELRILPNRTQADVRLVLDTGPRFYFGEITIEAEHLNPDFVQRFVQIEPGTPYDVRRLLQLQLVLNDAEYFSYVEIQADPDRADEHQHVPVTVVTEPARPQRYRVGAGYATDTGARFNLGVVLRRVNARGHRFRSDLQLSELETAVVARYEIPIRNIATDRLDLSLAARQVDIGDAESTQYSLGISEHIGWRGFRRRLYLQLQREEFQFGDMPTEAAYLLYPGITLSRERSNDMMYPTAGYSVQFDVRGGSSEVFSDVSFLRLRADARWVRGLGQNTRLLLRGEAGALRTDGFTALPPSQRFFAGGDRSVRGYGYQMIGERNVDDDVIGGRHLLLGSIEVERLVYGDFGLAAFVDAGDAFNDTFSASVGAGAGLRWRSPVGMARLDIAHPFDTDDNYRVHLSIGVDL